MSISNLLLLRLVRRQIRLPMVQVYILAVAVACTITVSVLLLGNRFEQQFVNQAKTMLAADLVLESTSSPPQDQQLQVIRTAAVRSAQTMTFVTMASANGQFLLSSVKAVASHYPLRGELQVARDRFAKASAVQHGPAMGQVWVEDRVLDQLAIKPGDFITIGDHSFQLTHVLVYEPDRGSQFYSFTPRIMMHWKDVYKTGVIRPGSRANYRYLMAGKEAALESIRERLTPTLLPNQKLLSVESGNAMLATSLQRAMQFLTASSLVAIVLGAVAIALAAYKTSQGFTYSYALMRSLGMCRRQLQLAIWIPFTGFTVVAIVIGLLLGHVLHLLVVQQFTPLLQVDLPAAGFIPYVASATAAMTASLVFAWPFINRLQHVSELQLLQRHTLQPAVPQWIAAMFTGLTGLLYWITRDWLTSLAMTLGTLLLLAVLYGVVGLFIRLLLQARWHRSLISRIAARLLRSYRHWVNLQISVLTISVLAIVLVISMAEDLLQSWQGKVPLDAPNYFAMNLYPQDLPQFKQQLAELGVEKTPLYPVVRGRLSAINGEPIRKYESKESGRSDESLRRDLALTYSMQLPADNKIISGYWHKPNDSAAVNTVSVEQGVAENLDILPGDLLEFTVGTQKVTAKVTSIRSVEWESFRPNFYMIFYPGTLDALPTTFLTSFHLNQQQRSQVANLIHAFPTATFFDVDYLINRISRMAGQVASAVYVLLSVSLFAALIIFIIIEVIQYQSRVQASAVLKSLGASNSMVLKVYGLQFLWIGMLSGGLALLLNLLATTAIGHYMFAGEMVINLKTIAICLLFAPAIILLTGLIAVKKTSATVPAKLLQSLNGE